MFKQNSRGGYCLSRAYAALHRFIVEERLRWFAGSIENGGVRFSASRPFLLLAIAVQAWASDDDESRWQIVNTVPAEVRIVLDSSREDLGSGVTPRMLDGMNRYIRGLEGIIEKLGGKYYSPPLTPDSVSNYVEALNTRVVFESKMDNPRGEFTGTIAPLETHAQIADELENSIVRMVEKITEDESGFSMERWKSEWSKALKK